jgi:hypothetical protein
VGYKGFRNYWNSNTLLCCGTWIGQVTKILTSDQYNTYPYFVENWWRGPAGIEPPCLNSTQLNGYVDATTDRLRLIENLMNKKCFYLNVIDGIHTFPSNDRRYVWNAVSRWGNFVTNNPPKSFPDVY